MKEPPTPPPDEYATFRRLAERLVTVPKKELDEKRATEEDHRSGPPPANPPS